MAKDFYKRNEDGTIKHRVVVGRTNYEAYETDGWSTIKPEYDPDLIITNPPQMAVSSESAEEQLPLSIPADEEHAAVGKQQKSK